MSSISQTLPNLYHADELAYIAERSAREARRLAQRRETFANQDYRCAVGAFNLANGAFEIAETTLCGIFENPKALERMDNKLEILDAGALIALIRYRLQVAHMELIKTEWFLDNPHSEGEAILEPSLLSSIDAARSIYEEHRAELEEEMNR